MLIFVPKLLYEVILKPLVLSARFDFVMMQGVSVISMCEWSCLNNKKSPMDFIS